MHSHYTHYLLHLTHRDIHAFTIRHTYITHIIYYILHTETYMPSLLDTHTLQTHTVLFSLPHTFCNNLARGYHTGILCPHTHTHTHTHTHSPTLALHSIL